MNDLRPPSLAVGITTRNRPDCLARCVRSLELLGDQLGEVIVIDDASRAPVELTLRQTINDRLARKLVVVRHDAPLGYIAARNAIARLASSELLLSLDDDAFLIASEPIEQAAARLGADRALIAVALAQLDESGARWPPASQPGTAAFPCHVPAFLGFAVLLRRELFLRLGGYRTRFVFYGEEKEFCLRAWDRGYRVLYLPDAAVAHWPSRSERDLRAYVRYAVRNDLLDAVYTWPAWLLPIAMVRRWTRYGRMVRALLGRDPGGWRWLAGELWREGPNVWRERSPVRWRTLRDWRQLRLSPTPYRAPGG